LQREAIAQLAVYHDIAARDARADLVMYRHPDLLANLQSPWVSRHHPGTLFTWVKSPSR
jgi:hypothetical protein